MSDPDRITEADIDRRPTHWGEPVTEDLLLTAEEWWEDYAANACCPDQSTAAALLCGCRGSGEVPSGISRLLREEDY